MRLAAAGVRAAVEQARARDPVQPRLQPEPAVPLEVPLHDEGRRVLGAHPASALPFSCRHDVTR